MRRPSKKPVRTKERYILDSLLSVFRGGHWVQGDPVNAGDKRGTSAPTPENYEQPLYLTVIGGVKYDERRLRDHLSRRTEKTAIVGAGRGVESDIAKDALAPVIVIEPDVEMYGKSARKINVEQVLSFAPTSPLLLVGNGERVKQARAWLKRARWNREVIELP